MLLTAFAQNLLQEKYQLHFPATKNALINAFATFMPLKGLHAPIHIKRE